MGYHRLSFIKKILHKSALLSKVMITWKSWQGTWQEAISSPVKVYINKHWESHKTERGAQLVEFDKSPACSCYVGLSIVLFIDKRGERKKKKQKKCFLFSLGFELPPGPGPRAGPETNQGQTIRPLDLSVNTKQLWHAEESQPVLLAKITLALQLQLVHYYKWTCWLHHLAIDSSTMCSTLKKTSMNDFNTH